MRKASFTMFDRGLLHGSFGFRVQMAYPESPARTLFTALDKFRESYPWVEKLLYIVGDSPSVEETVSMAKERGWVVAAEFDGKRRPNWLSQVDYRAIVITDEEGPAVKFNELLYRPPDETPLKEPVIPKEFGGHLYVDGTGRDLKEIFEFMAASRRTWRMYLAQPDRFEMDLDVH